MAFQRKYERLLELLPDVAIIPECANKDVIRSKAPEFKPSSFNWVGENKHKGLGVFTFGSFKAAQALKHQEAFPYILPLSLDGPRQFNLLAVWACHNKKNSYVSGIGPLRRSISHYRDFIESGPTIVAGDFNDNVRWDKPNKLNKHANNVAELAILGLQSAYHNNRGIGQGSEPEPTIYWRNRKVDGPQYHIDYCFAPDAWMASITFVALGTFDEWVAKGLSDHVPLIVDFSDQ